MPTVEEIRWLAAWLEGEGSFYIGSHNSKRKKVSRQIILSGVSTDYDVMQTVQRITGKHMILQPHSGIKMQYTVRIVGFLAIQWMMTLYSLMHSRRKTQICTCIKYWKTIKFNYATNR